MKTRTHKLSTPSNCLATFLMLALLALSAPFANAAKTIAVTGNLSFGSVAVGSTAQLSMTISNGGNNTLSVSGITYPTGFSGSFTGTIHAGNTVVVPVTFAPTLVTNYSGTVTVNSDATTGNSTLTASGTGTGPSIALLGSLAFGNVAAGGSSQLTLTITNTGTASFNVTSISYPAGFSGSFSGTIASHTSANVVVTFSPNAVANFGGTVTVNSTALAGVNTISASGTGTGGVIALGGNLSFGGVIVGSSTQQTLVISNVGNASLTVSSVSLPAGFSGAFSGTIAAGDSTNVTVTFSPTDSIGYSGNVSVSSDAFSGTSTIGISGTGIAQTRIISLSGDLTFGSVPVGSSSQQILTITNTGNSTLTITNILLPTGFSGDWTFATVAPGATTNLTVTFSPIAVVSYGGTITVESDATGGNDTVTANASGVGLGALIAVGGNLSFGNVIVGASAQQTLVISNTGNSTLTVTNISLPAGFSGSFSGDIAAGASTNVTITFTPTDTIVYGGTVTVTSDAINGVNTILASGTGIAQTRIIAVSGDLNFGNVAVGSSNQLTLTITNLGNWLLTITNVTYPNGFSGDFTNGTILAGATTNITVTFTPTVVGNYSGAIVFGSDQTSGANGATASGVGTGPLIAVGGNLDFGTVTVGTSAQQTLIISNTGNSTLTVASISYPAGFSGAFTGTIEGGASTNVTVTFSPTDAISYGGTVTVNSDALGGNNTIAASGTGVNPVFNYTPAKAKFNGLFFPSNNVAFTNSGNITISVNKKGKFTAHIRLAGKQYPFTGTIAADGSASGIIHRKGLNPIGISLQVGDNGDLITGTVSDEVWTANLVADRATFNKKTNPAPQAGVYSLTIVGSGDALTAPATNGTGTVTISASGLVKIQLTLGDGSHATQTTALAKDGQIPFFSSLYGGKGSILGWLSISGTDISGDVAWFKLASTNDPNYPDGFTLFTTATGVKQ